MGKPILKTSGNFVSLEIGAAISDPQSKEIARQIESVAAAFGKVRLIIFLKPYPSLNSAEDLYDDLRFVKFMANQIDKVAIIAEGAWQRTWTALFGLFSGVAMAFFEDTQRQEASDWIQHP